MVKRGGQGTQWTRGNGLELLENGESYFPKLFAAIDAAESEVILETYIWYEDEIGRELAAKLIAAAHRGVAVRITVDGFGTPSFSERLLGTMTAAGIEVCSYDTPWSWRWRMNPFCRLHRKIVVVDGEVAFVGGINVWALHLRRFGERSMQDYAVRATGPVVDAIHAVARRSMAAEKPSRVRRWRNKLRRVPRETTPTSDGGRAAFVARDNRDHPSAIEAMYRSGIRQAKRSVLIANAYFFPGYGFLRDLVRAARRGVDVRIVLQGNPDIAISAVAASMLYDYLFAAGVRIYHYTERPLHAKVAVIDESWATVGSSNLDPISLGLNLEANLFAIDRGFAADLRTSLECLMAEDCVEVTAKVPRTSVPRRLLLFVIYHLTRHMPRWGSALLRRSQTIAPMRP